MEPSALLLPLKKLAADFSGACYYDESPKHHTVRLAYSTDASVYQELPLAVTVPKNGADLKLLIHFAREHKVTLIPRTAGTSLAGQVVGNGIVVDVSKYFNDILEVNKEEGWVRVQPGIRDDLNAYLRPFGLMFGPETSTASRAMVGGMIGNNSCGLHSIVWGDTRKHLISAQVLLDDGSEVCFEALNEKQLFTKLKQADREGAIYRGITALLAVPEHKNIINEGYPKKTLTRRNTGYALDLLQDTSQPFNLCRLLAGSEGTLGIVTEAKLNLLPLPPKEIGLLCVHFHSLMELLRANVVVLEHQPEASELVDKYIMDFTKGHPTYQYNRFFIEGDPEALLMVEFRADTLQEVEAKAQTLKEDLIKKGFGYAYPLITGTEQTNLVWDVRKAGLGLIRNLPGDTQPVNLIEDCAVSPEDLPAYIEELEVILKKHQTKASYYAHAGAGELHVEPLINLKTKEGKTKFRNILAETASLVKRYNGSLSGEHGDGRLRGEFIGAVLGKEVYILLEQVKQLFDPLGVFNANKIVHTPPMDQFLRYEQDAAVVDIATIFDFKGQENILRLAEKCSGSGDCRKSHISGGAMCPSFMATREEKDTTRARANMLRQFLTNSTKANRFDHREIKEVMDLCLSCKACKTECPSGVDIAKMKAEFLQHYYDANGTPFRAWVIANFTKSQQLASYAPKIYNAVIKNSLLSSVVKHLIGFAPDRSLPEVGDITLRRWITGRQSTSISQQKKTLYLFCDEFTNYNDVGIGQTAYQLLTALGYEVRLAKHVESGRTYLSKGLVRKAKQIANKNVRYLKYLISANTPLIGIEPSAIITFRDEYLDLVDEALLPSARELAKHALLVDEFLAREMDAGNITRDQFHRVDKQIKLHGHCYQKAFHLMGFTEKILSFPKGHQVKVIPSGCCGMAGSFGYEKEHYAVSQKVGELILLPEVRETPVDVLIAAPGTSCRHQIKDGAGRKAFHPVEILWDALIK